MLGKRAERGQEHSGALAGLVGLLLGMVAKAFERFGQPDREEGLGHLRFALAGREDGQELGQRIG